MPLRTQPVTLTDSQGGATPCHLGPHGKPGVVRKQGEGQPGKGMDCGKDDEAGIILVALGSLISVGAVAWGSPHLSDV